jgi:hypothetical protein
MYSYSQHEIDGGKGDFAFASRNHNNVVQHLKDIIKSHSSLKVSQVGLQFHQDFQKDVTDIPGMKSKFHG